MKAITLWQPWASLIADGYKRVETRGWPTNHRGPVAIHAAMRPASDGIDAVVANLADRKGGGPSAPILNRLYSDGFPLGCVVCIADVTDCVRMEGDVIDEADPVERALGDWRPDRYAWILGSVQKLESPIPARGAQGFWEWEVPDAEES